MLAGLLRGNVVFVGVGNTLKGDDGAGPRIAKKTGGIDAGTAPENFISKITRSKPETVVIFDALDFGGKPGEATVVDAMKTDGILLSTHAIPLSKFACMLKPAKVWLVGIQPKSIGFGEDMSKEVLKSAGRIADEIAEWKEKTGSDGA